MINADIKPVITEKKDRKTYTWEIRNLPVTPEEPFAVSQENYQPMMLVGPTDFELDGYKSNISTWQDYGKFYYYLYKGRDNLPEELKQQIHKLTDNLNDPYKKIAVLYDYLQKNTHYVLIMFGIGGLQPYDATYVAKNKYGDCKALSNFMVSILKEAGIRAYPVAILGDEQNREFFPDFPSHQSNHIICAVPVNQDTVWLECTFSPCLRVIWVHLLPTGMQLLVNEYGGWLVHTPAYHLKDNTSIRKISAVLDQEGNLQLKAETSFKALSSDEVQRQMHEWSKVRQVNI